MVRRRWSTQPTWGKLNKGKLWWEHENGAYLYLNSDRRWWLDGPEGYGLYVAPEEQGSVVDTTALPPPRGWSLLGPAEYPAPTVDLVE